MAGVVMKERPILFSAPMVRSILEGRKTQTRRIIKPQPDFISPDNVPRRTTGPGLHPYIPCIYGQPGDQLIVRETWRYADWTEEGEPWIEYADGSKMFVEFTDIPERWNERLERVWTELSKDENYSIDNRAADRRWRPSIHMPRWASRITLEVVSVRVERLNEISEAEAVAEGIVRNDEIPFNGPWFAS